MARPPRICPPGIPQHLVARGVDRRAVFFRDEDYHRYLGVLGEAADKYGCRIHAYVLMTNHVHILATPDTEQAIPKIFQALGRKYVQIVNKIYDRSGTLWESRYKNSLVDSENYLLTCYRYIELNPVRAGIVSAAGSYPYSSHHRNAFGRIDPIITPHLTYLELGVEPQARRNAYRALFDENIPAAQLSTIRHAARTSNILGSERFKGRIEELLGQPLRSRRRAQHSGERSSTVT